MNKERKLKYTKDQDLLESREVLTNLSKCKGLEKLLGLFLCLRFDGHFCVVQQIHLLHSMDSKPEAGILSFGWNPSTAQLLNLMRYLQTNFHVTRKSYCPNSSHLLFCLCCWTERQLVWFITKWPGEERFFSYCWMFWKDPALESFPE